MISALRPYPSYVEAGLPWLNHVPERWEVRRIKTLFREVDERSGDGRGVLLSLTRAYGIVPQAEASGRLASAEDLSKYKVCRPGDLVMNRMQAWSGMFGLSSREGLVSPDYSVFRAITESSVKYFEYLFKTPALVTQFAQRSKGIGSGFNRLYTPDFGAVPVVVPPLADQIAIVRFLDHVDRRIARYIAARQRLIALVEEQKRALARQAINDGLDESAKRKPSGLPWYGDVPSHWDVLALKRVLLRLIDCEHKTAPAVDRSEFRVVRTSAIRDGELHLAGTYCTSEAAYRDWTRRGVPEAEDVMFTREAPVGEACLVPPTMKLCLGQRTVLMKLDRLRYDPRFLIHMIYSGPPYERIQMASQGSTVDHFNMDDIGAMAVVAPPLEEQIAIIRRIDAEAANLNATVDHARQEISLLREYRIRLAADVLTGTLDVRAVGDGLPEPEAHDDLSAILSADEDAATNDVPLDEEAAA